MANNVTRAFGNSSCPAPHPAPGSERTDTCPTALAAELGLELRSQGWQRQAEATPRLSFLK